MNGVRTVGVGVLPLLKCEASVYQVFLRQVDGLEELGRLVELQE
jgi:hypothetical protein